MTIDPTILLRADVPAYTVATQLVDRLGFRLHRTINRQLMLERPVGDQFMVVRVADHRVLVPGEYFDSGYDIHLHFSPVAGDAAAREAAVWEFFDEVREGLGVPAILSDSTRPMAAWSTRLGLRRFPPSTAFTVRDRDQWADYALPEVPEQVPVAPEDTLGQLYARIVADPEDDEPRLAYADAVADEHPDYAELIRLQVRYAQEQRVSGSWDPPRWQRMNQLERQFHREVPPPLVRGLLGQDWLVRRGFVEAAVQTADLFISYARELVATVPLRMVYLTSGATGVIAELAALPELARLRGLSFWGNPIGDDGLCRFLDSPYLTGLRWLNLERTGVTAAGIEALAASEALPGLRYVAADQNLRLNPAPGYDWDGALVQVDEPYLAMVLAERYDRAWLRWQPVDGNYAAFHPEYAEV